MDSHRQWHDAYERNIPEQNSSVQDIADYFVESPLAERNAEPESSHRDTSAPKEVSGDSITPIRRASSAQNLAASQHPLSEDSKETEPPEQQSNGRGKGKERAQRPPLFANSDDQSGPNGDVSPAIETTSATVL
jgi:hypothetical protein